MTGPTPEQMGGWTHEWVQSGASKDTTHDVYVARRAAAWAREQALEEILAMCAQAIEGSEKTRIELVASRDPSAMVAAGAVRQAQLLESAIRALKEQK